jgi:hypothetical protein
MRLRMTGHAVDVSLDVACGPDGGVEDGAAVEVLHFEDGANARSCERRAASIRMCAIPTAFFGDCHWRVDSPSSCSRD